MQIFFSDCVQTTSVMSTNAIAYLLLTKFRDGVTIDRLVVAMDELRKDLDYARKDLGFSGDSIDVINYAVSILKTCIIENIWISQYMSF